MKSLLLLNFLYVLRSRVLIAILLFTLVVQHLAIRLAKSVVVHLQEQVHTVQDHEVFFVATLILALASTFLAVVYGTWGVPYLHRGSRASLTFTLPISRPMYLGGYALMFVFLTGIQALLLLINYATVYGVGGLFDGTLNWMGFLLSLLLIAVAGLFWLFFQAGLSVTLGALPGFIMGSLAGFVLWVGGAFFRPTVEKLLSEPGQWFLTGQWIFDKLPAVAQFSFDLRDALHGGALQSWRFGVWVFWGLVAAAYLYWRMRKPLQIRGAEA